jgi:[ribosomal protein S5]-alanine N-acetyltransferase
VADDPVVLETPRLRLRRLRMADLDDLAALYADPEVRRFYPEGTLTREQTREELEHILTVYYAKYGFGLWATILRDTGELIGRCGLLPWVLEGQREVEVAYLLSRAHWGQGLATEAARAILDYGFATLDVPRLICLIDHDNAKSIRVAEKIGMTFDKEVDDGQGLALVYARALKPPQKPRGERQEGAHQEHRGDGHVDPHARALHSDIPWQVPEPREGFGVEE